MARLYWLGTTSTSVNTAANWSLYPFAGATLPPAAQSGPTNGDEIYFDWPLHSATNYPSFVPQGTISANLLNVIVDPDFELDIGAAGSRLGVSAANIIVSKKWQSNPEKGDSVPSVYINSTGPGCIFKSSLLGDADIPSAFSPSGTGPAQCVMDLCGNFETIECGGVYNSSNNPIIYRSETLLFGDTVETTLGSSSTGVTDKEVFTFSAEYAKTTVIFGSETTAYTREINADGGIMEDINIRGVGVTVKIYRGADFASNCGGLNIESANTTNDVNRLLFVRSAYAGATGYPDSGRTSVGNLIMAASNVPKANDPYVEINHGVDIQGKLKIASGFFNITVCGEATRTYGASARAELYVGETPASNPKVVLSPNCSIRELKVFPQSGCSPDVTFDGKPLKTLFINQAKIES